MTTTALIASIRHDIATNSIDAQKVSSLCDRAKETLNSAIKLEKALHEALKVIEKRKELTHF
jgi:hypothetical protein